MTLSDFGCSCDDCPAPTVEPRTIGDLEAAFMSYVARDRLRAGRPEFRSTALVFWDKVGVPVMREMGWEFGLRQITPALERWS